MTLDVRSIEVFYWLVTLKSFSRAAQQLNTSQPAVSQRLAALEQRIGHPLLHRPTRGCRPTERGALLFRYAEQLMLLLARMEDDLVRGENIRRNIRLGVSETIVHTWLSRFMRRVHAELPNLTVDITVDITPRMRQLLAAKELDLAFMLGPNDDATLENTPLRAYPLSFIAHPDLISENQRSDIHYVARFPIITYPRDTYPLTTLRERISRIVMTPPRIFANASLSTMIRMARDGIGVALIPTEVVADELAAGQLVRLDVDLDLQPLQFVAVHAIALDDLVPRILARYARDCGFDKSHL